MINKGKPIKVLDFDKLMRLAIDAGFRKIDFTKDLFFFALIYKEIIWRLALNFSKRSCNITNTEYLFDNDESFTLTILMDFLEKNQMHEFMNFILRKCNFIPNRLRDVIDMYIGFNYGNEGAIVIRKNDIIFITQEKFMTDDSEGSLTDEILDVRVYEAIKKFRKVLSNIIIEE